MKTSSSAQGDAHPLPAPCYRARLIKSYPSMQPSLGHLKFPLLATGKSAASPPSSHLRHPAMAPSICRTQRKPQMPPKLLCAAASCIPLQGEECSSEPKGCPELLVPNQNACMHMKPHHCSGLELLGRGGYVEGAAAHGPTASSSLLKGAPPPFCLQSSLQSHSNAIASTNLCLSKVSGMRKPLKRVLAHLDFILPPPSCCLPVSS